MNRRMGERLTGLKTVGESRLTVFIGPTLKKRLRMEAARRGVSVGVVVREVLERGARKWEAPTP